jgi:hypothetical protein
MACGRLLPAAWIGWVASCQAYRLLELVEGPGYRDGTQGAASAAHDTALACRADRVQRDNEWRDDRQPDAKQFADAEER